MKNNAKTELGLTYGREQKKLTFHSRFVIASTITITPLMVVVQCFLRIAIMCMRICTMHNDYIYIADTHTMFVYGLS